MNTPLEDDEWDVARPLDLGDEVALVVGTAWLWGAGLLPLWWIAMVGTAGDPLSVVVLITLLTSAVGVALVASVPPLVLVGWVLRRHRLNPFATRWRFVPKTALIPWVLALSAPFWFKLVF